MGAILIMLVVLAVVGYFVLVAMGVVGAAKKSADEAADGSGADGVDRKKPGFFG